MRTQLSNNIVSSHDLENSREVLVYQWSNVRHGIFRSRFQRSISATTFSQTTNKASSGVEGERLHVVFGLTGILGKT